tara:strand:+ start:1294 stop:2205 length:912 start_codon:yes stop_codon:yes gene_type:complete
MADFTGQSVKSTYQNVLQIDTGSIQNGLGSVVNIPISQLSGSALISSSIQMSSDISGSFNSTSGALASTLTGIGTRVTSQEAFSSSLNSTFATDAEITAISTSLATATTTNQDNISINLGNINTLTAVTSSHASLLTTNHFNAGQVITGSLIQSGSPSFFEGTLNLFRPDAAPALANLNVYFNSITSSQQVFAGLQLIDQGGDDAKLEVNSYTGLDSTNPVFRLMGGGNGSNSDNTILRSFKDGRLEVTKTLIVSSSQFLELQKSPTLPASANTGSFAVTGSTLAFYDGDNWKTVTLGLNLPL